ncbi:hypothetical protein AWM69_09905 [Pseudomonas sp. D1HM]|nr:hypothetical protein [Pseudomonas sp. D1HM]
MRRDIGTAGELIIRQWCALSGITANPSATDRHGWDLHFEIPHLANIYLASGLHESNIECKVQVKTTDTKKKTKSIELSNLLSMATSTLPTFYILIEMAGGQQVQAAHLLHIDENISSKILERIRRETAKPGKLNLHLKTMSLDFKEGVKIQSLNGEGLKSEILKFIGPSQADYVIKKQTFIKSCGFEPGSYKISFQLDIGHTDKLVRILLGDNHSLEVKNLEATVTRFGISEKLNEIQSHTAVMNVSNVLPDGLAKAQFRNRRDGTALEFSFDTYRGGASACVPSKYRVVRLKSQRFSIDMSMYDNSMRMYFHAKEDVACELNELLKHYKLIKMMTNPSNVDFSMEIEGKVLTGKFNGAGFDCDLDISLEILEAANHIKNFHNYHDALEVVPNWFAHNGNNLISCVTLLNKLTTPTKVSIVFTCADGCADLTEAECIIAIPIILDKLCFVSLLVYSGNLDNKGGGSYELTPSKVNVIYKTHFTIDYLVSGKAILDLEAAADRYEGAQTIVPFIDTYMAPLMESAKRALAK